MTDEIPPSLAITSGLRSPRKSSGAIDKRIALACGELVFVILR